MDMQGYAQDRFEKIKASITALLRSAGWKVEEVQFLAIASLIGDNIVKEI